MVAAQPEGAQALGSSNSTAPLAHPAATAMSINSDSAPGNQAGVPMQPSYGQPIPPSVPRPDHGNNGNQQYGNNPHSLYPTIPSYTPPAPYGTGQVPPDYPAGKGGGISGGPPPVGGPPPQYVTSRPVHSSQRIFSPAEQFLLLLLAIFLPPVAVAIKYACNYQFWICLLLTILGHIPGMNSLAFGIVRQCRVGFGHFVNNTENAST